MFSTQEITQFKEICISFGINLSDEMIKKFQTYATLLLDWNKRIHLVSNKDAKGDRIIRHFVDSLSIFSAIDARLPSVRQGSTLSGKVIDLLTNANVLDIGSGAGFPSFPMKIVKEDLHLTLMESVHKKTLFLQKLSGTLRLENVSILNQRAEKLIEEDDFKNKFDLVTAKAMGRLEDTIRLAMPFLKIGGLVVVYKGKGVEKEIECSDFPEECHIKDVVKIEISEIDLFRWLVVIEKMRQESKET